MSCLHGRNALLLLVLTACGTPMARSNTDTGTLPFDCLRAGTTRRPEMMAQLGEPMRTYPGERIAMWRIVVEDERCMATTRSRDPQQVGTMTLVAEFDAADVLQRWTLVDQS